MGNYWRTKRKKLYILAAFPLILWGVLTFISSREISSEEPPEIVKGPLKTEHLRKLIDASFVNGQPFPEELIVENRSYKLEYTLNPELEKFIKGLLQQYRPEHTAVAVIDNETGEILAALDYERSTKQFGRKLTFSSTHPAASLFKIVTAADLLRTGSADVDTVFTFRGRSTTLYKHQLSDRPDRRNRYETLEAAFAHSNNVVFGKAAIESIVSTSLYQTATDFGFNRNLMEEMTITESHVKMPEEQYEMAQLASGFNVETTISPMHASLIASIVANEGRMNRPKLLSSVIDNAGENLLYENNDSEQSIDQKTAADLKELMNATIVRGTARHAFRRLHPIFKEELDIGGKTGSITGGLPHGKRDWFTAFAMPKDQAKGKGISVAVMNVNSRKWYVKSSVLAKEIIEYYFSKIAPLRDDILEIKHPPKRARKKRFR